MIYITGDTHGGYNASKLGTKNFPEQKYLSKSDYLIICGDFGFIWDNSIPELYKRMILNNRKFTTLFVDGNHENHALLGCFPTVDFCEGRAHKVSDSIYHLKRGEIFHIDDKTIFTMGGAVSIDKSERVENISWWSTEMPCDADYRHAMQQLDNVNWQVDIVITHCCSNIMQRRIIPSSYNREHNSITAFFDKLEKELKFSHWYFGHYHIDKEIDVAHTAVFNKIIKL